MASMPSRPRHPCNAPGCPALVDKGAYCEAHKGRAIADPERHRFETSAAWQRERLAYLHEHPLCEDCLEQGKTEAATEVHHMDYVHKPHWLRALSMGCHSVRTRRGE
jgi:5-methylcytosine-specific restriction enzyme A